MPFIAIKRHTLNYFRNPELLSLLSQPAFLQDLSLANNFFSIYIILNVKNIFSRITVQTISYSSAVRFMKIKALVFILVLPIITYAQDITGNIEGRIVDTSGIPLTGVDITLQSENMQGIRGASSDNYGHFKILVLPIGSYKVKVSSTGYENITFDNVQVALGKTTNLGLIYLNPQTVNLNEVVVSGNKIIIDPNSTAYGGTLRSKDFENLPIDRNYKSMISLLPQSNLSFLGDGVNIAGATGSENKYFIDGVEVTEPMFGESGTSLPYNFIREIEVKAGGYDAESRSSLGGVLNVVTYSGTNELHGSAFGFYTGNRFATHRRVGLSDPTQGGFSNYDVGFGIGGPIIHNELWFFVAYNPTFARRDVDVPGYGIYIDHSKTNSFAAKFTWTASDRLHVIMTATGDPAVEHAVGNGVVFPPSVLMEPDSYLMNIGNGGINISISGTYTAGDRLIIDGSAARVTFHSTGDPATDLGMQETFFYDHITDSWSGGPQSKWDSFRYSNSGRVAASLIAEAHTLKLGLEYKVIGTDNRYTSHSIDRWEAASYEESFVSANETVHEDNPSIFLQDKWQISRKISIHGGIRWDGQFIVGSDGNVDQKVTTPLQPRIGFVYLLDTDGSQRVFGSFGRFSQDFALAGGVNQFSNQGYYYNIHYRQDPRVSRAGDSVLYSGQFSLSKGVQGLRGQYFDEFILGYERAVFGNLRVSLQGVYRTLREAIDDAYLASEGAWSYGNPGAGVFAAWPRPRREYTALILSVEQHEDEHFNFLASYVLSRNYGNYGGLFDAAYPPTSPNFGSYFDDLTSTRQFGIGLLPNDRTHIFKFSGSYRFNFGLSTGITFTAQTGTPLSEYVGLYQINTLALYAPRGSAGRTPAIWDLSMRLLYDLPVAAFSRVRFIVDVFDIASQRRPVDFQQLVTALDPVTGYHPVSTYGQAIRYQPPTSVRLGMEVSF